MTYNLGTFNTQVWQDIKTAPEGTSILVTDGNVVYEAILYIYPDELCVQDPVYSEWTSRDRGGEITHWMHLPPAPNSDIIAAHKDKIT